jgi:CheY-like chemotaxis protein
MSLLGRLEDLSLPDIVQIVYLSRRTGILEIVNEEGRYTVVFRQGLVVNASAPAHPDLVTYLEQRKLIPGDKVALVRKMEDRDIPCGTTAVEMNLISPESLTSAVQDRIHEVIGPLLGSRHGEFNFILSESMTPVDVEYDLASVFKDGGFPPQKILGAPSGEKLKPLQGLEESLKVGKALLRGGAPAQTAQSLDVAPAPIQPQREPEPEAEPFLDVPSSPPPETDTGKFRVSGGLFDVVSPDGAFRNVILLERNPLIRVAAKRAFSKNGTKILQFGSIEDAKAAIADFFRTNSFFITFLEMSEDDSVMRLLHQVKRRSPRLPVVIIDAEADLRRRHDVLREGADLYLTKPPESRLQPGLAEQELSLFADEMVLFAERAFGDWQRLTGAAGAEAGKRFYEMANKEHEDRSAGLLQRLITELSDPNDITEVSSTILRLAAEYLERGALFMTVNDEFVGLGGFDGDIDARAKSLRISRTEPSILGDVLQSGKSHQGKMRKTPANVHLIETLGGMMPTEVVALPIMHDGQAIGILYGDNAEQRGPIENMTGLEIFLSQAGYAFGTAVSATLKGEQGEA